MTSRRLAEYTTLGTFVDAYRLLAAASIPFSGDLSRSQDGREAFGLYVPEPYLPSALIILNILRVAILRPGEPMDSLKQDCIAERADQSTG